MKKLKKITLGLGATAAMIAPITATVSCSLFGNKNNSAKSSRQFWNYEDYIQVNEDDANDPSSIKNQIDASYEYNEFPDLPSFKTAIVQGRAAAGIGSDYFNARLAEEKLIQKIDFSRLFGMTTDRSEWEHLLSTQYYTPEAWKLLDSIKLDNLDKDAIAKAEKDRQDGNIDDAALEAIKHDVDGDGVEDKLWEYMAPYFMQNKVIAVNLTKLNEAQLKAAFPGKTNVTDITAEEFNNKFSNKSYKETFQALATLGVKTFTVNDYMRDNMMIGSEEMTDGFTSSVPVDAGKPFESTVGKQQIDGFFNLLKSVDWHYQALSSGVDTLETVAQPKGNKNGVISSEAALMYNGDALAAYGGGYSDDADNYKKQVRIIVPKNPSFMLDGFVISKDIQYDKTEMNRIYELGRNVLYQGANTTYKAGMGAKYTVQNNIYKNFDYVNYTAAFKSLYEYLNDGDNYFGEDDKYIHDAPATANAQIDAKHITTAISDDTTNDLDAYYQAKWAKVAK